MSKFNVGDIAVAKAGAPYFITTDGWEGEVVGVHGSWINVTNDKHRDPTGYRVQAAYFDNKADGGGKKFGDLTDAEKGALLLAAHNGYDIQFRWDATKDWGDIEEPGWNPVVQYRLKPDAAAEKQVVAGLKHEITMVHDELAALQKELESLI